MTAPIVMCFLLGLIAFVHGIWHITVNCKNNNYGRLFDTEQAHMVHCKYFLYPSYVVKSQFRLCACICCIVFLFSVWLLHDKPSYTKILGMIFAMIHISMKDMIIHKHARTFYCILCIY